MDDDRVGVFVVFVLCLEMLFRRIEIDVNAIVNSVKFGIGLDTWLLGNSYTSPLSVNKLLQAGEDSMSERMRIKMP